MIEVVLCSFILQTILMSVDNYCNFHFFQIYSSLCNFTYLPCKEKTHFFQLHKCMESGGLSEYFYYFYLSIIVSCNRDGGLERVRVGHLPRLMKKKEPNKYPKNFFFFLALFTCVAEL